MTLAFLVFTVVAAFALLYLLLDNSRATCPLCGGRARRTQDSISCDRCGDFFEFFV